MRRFIEKETAEEEEQETDRLYRFMKNNVIRALAKDSTLLAVEFEHLFDLDEKRLAEAIEKMRTEGFVVEIRYSKWYRLWENYNWHFKISGWAHSSYYENGPYR